MHLRLLFFLAFVQIPTIESNSYLIRSFGTIALHHAEYVYEFLCLLFLRLESNIVDPGDWQPPRGLDIHGYSTGFQHVSVFRAR